MSSVKLYVHAVWATKYRKKTLRDEFRPDLWTEFRNIASRNNIWLLEVNGYNDHVHCIIQLKPQQNLSKVMQILKGGTSHWINNKSEYEGFFKWQREYWAESFGPKDLNRIQQYVQNQPIHHKERDLQKECEELGKDAVEALFRD